MNAKLYFAFTQNQGETVNKKIKIVDKSTCIPIVVEKEAYSGVQKIGSKSATDIELVTGKKPEICSTIPKNQDTIILYATVGKSALLDKLEQTGKVNFAAVRSLREVYGIYLVEEPWAGVKQALVVAGSDKRGTIYGIFSLSEVFGVSPLVFWGDAKPMHRDVIELDETAEVVSKEPSVRYRGFFINDEWPCFGNWTFEHFGGFTAKMYDHVFELLLRLKGNYLWPAMWTSSFALDGPGNQSEQLADEYGVIMGNSHHEPCLRASEEWDIYKGEHTAYKTAWDYTTNKDGLLEYWKDGLKRSSKYENIITVGMRGERDSQMQGTCTLEDNIAVLKDIITQQNRLIDRYADTTDAKKPRLLAIYKEVERYFYGTDTVQGLRNWDGLDDIILMLCEDNFGNMRTLPDEQMRQHKGGIGMYYHLDYHGGPISYEWINTTPLTKIWEQMTEAYEYGVTEVWMVNVGDLKGNEFPLSYFMNLAYDYETWGITQENSAKLFAEQWIAKQFQDAVSKKQVLELADILTESVDICHLRRPEAMNSQIYHSAHYGEADRMIERILLLCQRADAMKEKLGVNCKDVYYSLIYHPLQSGMDVLLMQLYAGKNELYARQGKVVANKYQKLVQEAIAKDRELSEVFGNLFDQKWKGMELESHIGFTKWNEDGCHYPIQMMVEPFGRPRMVVSRATEVETAVKNYGQPDQIVIRDFLYAGSESVVIEVANDGTGSFLCQVEQEACVWLQVDWDKKEIAEQETLTITCKMNLRPQTVQEHKLYLTDGDTTIELLIYAKQTDVAGLPELTFFEQDGVVAMHAEHFAYQQPAAKGEWKILSGYGRTKNALKAFPLTSKFTVEDSPYVAYRLAVEEEDNYSLEVWSAPSNPLELHGNLCFGVAINQEKIRIMPSVSADYQAGEPANEEWSQGVLNQVHKSIIPIQLQKGLNEIRIYAIDSGFVLEELLVYRNPLKPSYLGPQESFYLS